jgi:hypothetical protein
MAGIYEIKNWFYVKRIIREHQNTADWQQFNLRADWIGRIYTVLNPQMPGDKGDTQEVLRLKYADRLKPINMYLDNLGLGIAVAVASEEVKDSESMLVVWYPIFEMITFWKVFWTIAAILLFFLTRLDSWTYQGISYAWNFFF